MSFIPWLLCCPWLNGSLCIHHDCLQDPSRPRYPKASSVWYGHYARTHSTISAVAAEQAGPDPQPHGESGLGPVAQEVVQQMSGSWLQYLQAAIEMSGGATVYGMLGLVD